MKTRCTALLTVLGLCGACSPKAARSPDLGRLTGVWVARRNGVIRTMAIFPDGTLFRPDRPIPVLDDASDWQAIRCQVRARGRTLTERCRGKRRAYRYRLWRQARRPGAGPGWTLRLTRNGGPGRTFLKASDGREALLRGSFCSVHQREKGDGRERQVIRIFLDGRGRATRCTRQSGTWRSATPLGQNGAVSGIYVTAGHHVLVLFRDRTAIAGIVLGRDAQGRAEAIGTASRWYSRSACLP